MKSFSTIHKKKLVKKSRTIVRSGIALSYTNGQSKLKYPYTLKATRDTKMLVLSNLSFRRLFKNNSKLALLILKRQIWQIEKFRQSATGLTHYIEGDEKNL